MEMERNSGLVSRRNRLHGRIVQEPRQAHFLQGRLPRRSRGTVQLQHGGECPARHRYPSRRQDRRTGTQESRPRRRRSQLVRKEEEDMSSHGQYTPGAASGAKVRKEGETWTLVLVRDLAHPPAKVWKALPAPDHLREWAPFDSDRNLAAVGTAKLSTVGAPTPHVTETQVKRADAPKVLEYSWGEQDIRWELEPLGGGGTRLTLWHNIDRRFISMGAARCPICFDVLDRLLAGQPIGRIVGAEAMKFGGWQRLNAEYAKQFGVETSGWPSRPT